MSKSDWSAIFDMDGVLVDSSEAHFQAWHRLGMQEGKPFTRELFQLTFGMHNQQIVPLWMEQEVEQTELERLADWKETTYRELVPALMRPIPGVLELLEALHQEGVTMAVGSSGPLPNIQLVLEQLNIAHYFSALSTGEDVRHGKPDPEVFLVAARRLGREPQRCVVLEDAPQGVEAARRGGMAVLGIASSRAEEDLLADRVVTSFEGLLPADLRALLVEDR
ncbi:HAD family phosphatase [bacterium]|nr:HAD family phosphatase [bacterium]